MKPSTKSRDKYILNFEYLFNACYAVKAASGVLTGKRFQKLKWVNDRFLLACLTVLFLCISPTTFAQVGIGTTTPDASAILDLTSTTKGVLISRVTQVQRSAIASPATGLLVFQTDNNPGYYYNAGTPGVPNWTHLFSGSSAGGWDLTGNAGTTVGTNFLGTTDAQDFAIYTNNAEKIRITSGGNVGIGTATPSIKLNTYTATGVENRFAVQSNSDFVEIYVRDTDANGTALAWSSGDNLRFGTQTTLSGTGWSEKMRMLSNGNLGIGTTSPNALLSLGTLTANSKLLIYDAGGTDTYGFGISANLLRIHSSGATTDIGFFAGAAGAEVMRVKGNGNVGIGTTAPGVKLAVWDATSPSLHLRRDATNEWYFTATPAGSDRLAFRAGGNTSANERMTILSGGNVGIGTTAPTGKLTVVENNESTTLTDFTQAVTKAGILISTEYTVGAFTPGIFWQTSNNNPTKPKAGIWLFENGSGSDMYFGTSTSYATGITNTGFVLDESGQVGIGTTSPGTRLQLFTDNTANANTQAISINRSGTNVEGAIRWFTGGASR
ncbi:MAG: hypothetical protein JKY52_07800, partial [Flavobacteriales bacterium]|nr:hypothetical protein [Flavobacteriales bacterium]